MVKDWLLSLWDYIRNTELIILLFVFAELTKIVGFLPHIPDIVIYGILIGYSLYCLLHTEKYDFLYIILLAYIPLEILIMSPNSMFSPWLRYFLFAILIITCTGMCLSGQLVLARGRIFVIICFCCAVIGVGSFFARLMGINFMRVYYDISYLNHAGIFGGLASHSMLLGPAAGVGTMYLANSAFKQRKWYLWASAALCFASVLFSDSRSAFLSTIAGVLVLIMLSAGNINKFFKYIIALFIASVCTMPLWQNALDGLAAKQERNISSGSTFHSRADKWGQRIEEFKSSPIVGYGFASVDPANKDQSIGAGGKSIETGSSWLSVLSMTGIIGFILIMWIYIKAFLSVYKWTKDTLLLSVLTLLSVNMCTEGYIFFGGSFLAFLFWITIGVCSDQAYELSEDIEH